MFAFFMDYMVYPIFWLASPKAREHARYVKVQNAHLSGEVHQTPDMTCWYCRAREVNRRRES